MKHIWKLLLALIAGVLVLIGLTGPSAKNASTPAPAAAGSAAAPVAAATPVPAAVPAQAATPSQPPVAAAVPAPVAVPAAAPAAAPAPIQTRKTLNQKTQNVLLLEDAIKDGGVRAEMSIKSQGIGIAADAYRTSVGKLSIIAVDQKMSFFQAEKDRKPKDYKEFMDKIIEAGKPDGIQLPMLPYYQEYAYDPEAYELVVIEFPAKKEQRQKETTGAAGL
jgi:type IV secretory pathway VirB10-like protein